MDKQNICGIKHRLADFSLKEYRRVIRMKVDISDDTWLEALKFLICRQWSQNRYVSRQINRVVQRNISRLPKMVIDNVQMYYIEFPHNEQMAKNTVVAFDTVMQENQTIQWFRDRGFTFNAPQDIPAESVLISDAEPYPNGYISGFRKDNYVNVRIRGSAQVDVPIPENEETFPWYQSWWDESYYYGTWCKRLKPVLYYAKFNPLLNEYSWDYLAQFLKLIYHPTSYMKKISMDPVNQKFIDFLQSSTDIFDSESRYIRCEYFSLYGIGRDIVNLSDALNWMKRNVRAEKIRISQIDCKDYDAEAFDMLADFFLLESGAAQCVSKIMELNNVPHKAWFVKVLIQKFYTLPLIESFMPSILMWYPPEIDHAYLGPNVIDKEVDSEGADELYMISNGANRMRISFIWVNYYRLDTCNCNIKFYSV